jgi:uncharacterized protein
MKAKFAIAIICLLLLIVPPAYALKQTTVYMPAVQETDYGTEGAMATLTVDVKPGKGHVYVDTFPLAKVDTQASARIARNVACDALFIDCAQYDFFYTIRSDARIVGGPSGGAAMAVATMASILDLEVNNRALITGTINPDGSIGQVSGLLEKAQIASEKGDTFLIPYGQSIVKAGRGGDEIDLTLYAKDNWNLTVREIRYVREAFEIFTNYKLRDIEIEFVKSEEYQDVMKDFGEVLLGRAKSLQENCRLELNRARLGYDQKEELRELCEESLDEAQNSLRKKDYYSSASLAFSKSISYQHAIRLSGLLESQDKKGFAKDYLSQIEGHYFETKPSNIELYAIIQERYSEYQENLEIAWKKYYTEDYSGAVYYAALAEERLYTARLWNERSGEFPNYISAPSENLDSIATGIISDAHAALTYTNLISPNSFSALAETLLKKAESEKQKGNYYAAIVQALKGKANAEIAAQISGASDYKTLIDANKKRALVSLSQSDSIIGQSYFEYAQTLEDTNEGASLTYYAYAEKLSKLNNILNEEPLWQNIEPTEYIEPVECDYRRLIPLIIVSSIICFLIGFLI